MLFVVVAGVVVLVVVVVVVDVVSWDCFHARYPLSAQCADDRSKVWSGVGYRGCAGSCAPDRSGAHFGRCDGFQFART